MKTPTAATNTMSRVRTFGGGGPRSAPPVTTRRVLNTGSGPASLSRLHAIFRSEWTEIRLDIDPKVKPDIVGTVHDMRGLVGDRSVDAIWSSHNLEHLFTHEVLPALLEFKRVLKDDGFALITCPDLRAIAAFLVAKGPSEPAYMSPAGPIAAIDMLYGHGQSIEAGNHYMAHNTGFTLESLGDLALQAGFTEARVAEGGAFDLWALMTMPKTDFNGLANAIKATSERFLFDD